MKAIFLEASLKAELGSKSGDIFGCSNLPYYLVEDGVFVDFSSTKIDKFSSAEKRMLECFFEMPITVLFRGRPFANTTIFQRVDCVSAEYLPETAEVMDFEQEASKLSREIYYLEATDTLDVTLLSHISNE